MNLYVRDGVAYYCCIQLLSVGTFWAETARSRMTGPGSQQPAFELDVSEPAPALAEPNLDSTGVSSIIEGYSLSFAWSPIPRFLS